VFQQESRAVASKPRRDAAAVLFRSPTTFIASLGVYSQASTAMLQSSKHTGAYRPSSSSSSGILLFTTAGQ